MRSRQAIPPLHSCRICGDPVRSWSKGPSCAKCRRETRQAIKAEPLGLREIQRARQAEREARA